MSGVNALTKYSYRHKVPQKNPGNTQVTGILNRYGLSRTVVSFQPATKPLQAGGKQDVALKLLYVCGSRSLGAVNHLKLYLVAFI